MKCGDLMKIQTISLTNFKGIEDIKFNLDGKSTVFYGINGVGKSSVLRAINLLFSTLINKIVNNKFKQGISIDDNDITFNRSDCTIAAEFKFDDNTVIPYHRNALRATRRRTHAPSIANFVELFNKLYLIDEAPYSSMPIFVNYGVNRSVLDVPLRIKNQHTFDRLSAFENAIESRIDFRVFFEWFRYQEDLENQIKVETKNLDYEDIALKSVKLAVSKMLGNITDIHVKRSPLSMCATKGQTTLRIEQLSDGEKCTLALFGDLARRLGLANPNSENPLEGFGIVLIDEIELHMHPMWQRKIIPTLKELFPNVQFLITTHSPQVLSELDNDFNIISLKRDESNAIYCDFMKTYGLDSNVILEELMETSSSPIIIKDLVNQMFILIQSKKYVESLEVANRIDLMTAGTNDDVVKARILIARGQKNEENR